MGKKENMQKARFIAILINNFAPRGPLLLSGDIFDDCHDLGGYVLLLVFNRYKNT